MPPNGFPARSTRPRIRSPICRPKNKKWDMHCTWRLAVAIWRRRTSKRSSDTKGQVMTVTRARRTKASSAATRTARLFLLELSGDRIHSMNPDGSDRKTIVTNCRLPDGIVVDVAAGHIYWTNMGVPELNDGSIERADLDGKNRKVIVPPGGTHTP